MGALNRIWAVGLSTFKEAVKNRAFVGLMIGSLAMIVASVLLSELVVPDQRKRVVQNFGLSFISFAGVLIAVTMGILLVYSEINKKTIYTVISKPINRWEFIVGKYIGMTLLLLTITCVLSLCWFLVLHYRGVSFRVEYMYSVVLVFAMLSLVGAVAIFFSSFSSPVLSGIFTFGVYVIGRQIPFLEQLLTARKGLFVSMPSLKPVGSAVVSAFPDLTMFDLTKQILLEIDIPVSFVLQSSLYAFSYVFFFVAVSCFVFSRREFV